MEWQNQPGRHGYFVTKSAATPDTYVIHRRCQFCRMIARVKVPAQGLWDWEHGTFVQDAFPDLTADQREMVMTGTHPACWEEAFPDEEED